jgi:DNA-binding XRE family transcriptional regulator
MKTKWNRKAMRFASAHHVARQRMLDVTFENGDHFLVATESVLSGNGVARPRPQSSRTSRLASAPQPNWADMRIGATGDVLEIPSDDAMFEIPWDRIRSIADPEFRAHLADQADERAKRIGKRIRDMRLQAGLTPKQLAERVNVSQDVVADLEAGKIDPPIDLIGYIAVALGKRLRDFSEE